MGCESHNNSKAISNGKSKEVFCENMPIVQQFEDAYSNPNLTYQKIIDFSDIKKGNIFVNLIHYDKNLKKKENFEYFRYFSIKVKGCYYSFDNFEMLKLYLSRQVQIPYSVSFILMISGNESERVLKEFHNLDILNEIIIFCFEINKYLYLKSLYNKVTLITNNFGEIVNTLRTKKLAKDDLKMENHIQLTPLISYFDYKKVIFPIHRILAYFFDQKYNSFSGENLEIAKKFVNKSSYPTEDKNKIINIMEKLKVSKDFPSDCIKFYTGENLCYIFNKGLRNFEKFYVEMAYFIGPFYYGIFRYALEHPEKQLKAKTILYRDLTLDRLDLYCYEFCENDIICFPSFTSTTIDKNLNYATTNKSNKINNNQFGQKSFVKMIITYDPKGQCQPQGLDISDKSQFSYEKEILLFPFTFFKIDKVEIRSGQVNDKHLIFMTIINKGDIIEYRLKKRYAFKLIENGTKLVIDNYNKSDCDDNEIFYKFKFKMINQNLL